MLLFEKKINKSELFHKESLLIDQNSKISVSLSFHFPLGSVNIRKNLAGNRKSVQLYPPMNQIDEVINVFIM